MPKISKPAAGPAAKRAVIYARVSSKEQEKEGFSIPAQLKLLREYAATQGFTVAQEYVDVETAKQTGRAAFGEMISYLKSHPPVRVLLVEKTDRLYRNLKDWVTVDELDVEIHLPKEGVVLSRDSRSSEKFMHGIKVLMAKNYIDNLSEEARKGMQEKAAQGIWPTVAPLGYRNLTGPDGKKIIEPDPETASLIGRLFEWYAAGTFSLREAARKLRAAGLVHRKSGAPVPVSTVHAILRNRLFAGVFEWNGRLYPGTHEPLVSPELWERVQGVLDGRQANKHRRAKHNFAFSGLIACGHCGCSIVGEIKKQRYIYYHCTGYKGRCNEPTSARRSWSGSFPICWASSASTTRYWSGFGTRCMRAMRTRRASMKPPSKGFRPNASACKVGWTRCISTSWTGGSTLRSTNGCRRPGDRSRPAASERSSGTRPQTSPTWTREFGFSNSHGTRSASSKSRNPEKSGGFSISWFRTARGRAVS
jgi:DNA invertase Pin-like site-specific DNA recombinase